LVGKATDKIVSSGHDRLSTFAIGADLKAAEWRAVIRQLVASGFLDMDVAGYGGLSRPTASSRPTRTLPPMARPSPRSHLVAAGAEHRPA
jgi:ATP-dependent DNA helicase RecQ